MPSRNKTAAERIGKWDRRYTAEGMKAFVEREKPLMLANMLASTTDLVWYEQLTKQELNMAGVSVIDVPDYLSFSREVWGRRRRYAGRLLNREVETLLMKWVSRKLERRVLEAIRTNVYSIPAPTP